MECLYIDDFTIKDSTRFVSCDTRDFYMIRDDRDPREGREVELWKKNLKIALDKLYEHPAKLGECIKSYEDCIKYLKELEQESGGKGEWRYLSFDNAGEEWIKYIRMLKIDDYWWFVFSEDYDDIIPLSNHEYNKENINKDFVNFEK